METAKINQFKADLMYFASYAIANNGRVTVSPEDGTITFSREISDDEYIRSIPGLAESIIQSMEDYKSGKDKGTEIDTSSFEAFEASMRNV